MLAKLSSNITLHPDPNYDCGSENYYELEIKDKIDLNDMHGRWYVTEKNTLKMLIDTDYDMIGKILKFRTPVKCASKDGICKICYGHLYNQNYGINAGINSSLKLSERNYQNTMSAKHVLNTNSENLKFNEEFYDYFTLTNGFKIELRDDIEDYESLQLLINHNTICRDTDIDDMEHNEYTHEIVIFNTDTGEKIPISDASENALYMAGQVFNIFNKAKKKKQYDANGWISIPFSKLNTEDDVFFVRLKNDELTKPLEELKKLIEKGKEIDASSVSELITKLRYLMKCGGIFTQSIHVEIVSRNLIRCVDNIIQLPYWSQKDPPYQITSVHNGILMSSSVINSLTFERLKEQLNNPLTYQKRGTNFLDRVFILE